ncbi:transient-receptor-potential-like protein [Drosophila gunungcola]|uniref:transient-receptor-potential-like protein n=1 Tax=Drosophila gunungcola TaxID=103775 RepID=UPI0022E26696|nr:transient-receptor-potential-like protein [Drosophila gunungcola]XP_052842897.1 transient-receptor-potential-like protein [Drosophila gunungcola]XP_052842898.1 transient-receptor-potential-like protein [Drosophila gunungcola]XP_052842899.1 transient-receptor-potential-like protein [Drosophila gunungcola]XP_052842900.1 transient-receptor-potential-like protein [Drosophila gunungcola]XP_052842902.1 transient-receptor-potential-like protein [Drosophila gunungcola]
MGRKKKLPAGVSSGGNDSSAPKSVGGCCVPLGLPQPLLLEEKKFLLAVERGDMPNVRRILQKALRHQHININCMDPLGRRALTLAIDNENLEMVELLVVMGVETKDALLHAINAEFVEAVELLLEHEELIYKEGEQYSWQKVDINTAMFAPDITPLMLAAHKNNFEILRILLDRGAAVPVPHDIRCGCEECVRLTTEDSLRHSLSRVNIYRALCSPSLICLTSNDPILTAFQLSWELRNLALTEQECKSEYMDLRRQCQKFAVDLLDQTRTSNELAIILNYDPQMSSYEPGDRMSLTRLVQAISYKQKKFVAHSNIQQLLSSIWYDGLPGFRRKSIVDKVICIGQVAVLFPLYCLIYMCAPNCRTGQLMRKPFMKFLIHASSYLFFLFILILVSQRADDDFVRILGTARMKKELAEQELRQRGQAPSKLELIVVLYVVGFVWEEVQEIFAVGMKSYLRNMWNFIDFLRNSLYVSVMCLRAFAYIQQTTEIARDPQMAYIPREKWHDFDPQLIAEGLFAAANVFSALKLVHLFSINPHLGPLQISLGRMVIDIVKFFFIYTLVLFAFACGLNQLLWYFAALEKSKCYVLPGGEADWGSHGDSCMKWRRFGNLFESSQSLFWASFGMVGLDDFELSGIKSYTRFWGLLMFGSYSVINVIVLLNLLIAMMSNSYAMIDEHSDTEWKFARTKLWMSYFEDSATLPPPFNVLPSVKWLIRVFRKSSKTIDRQRSKKRQEQEQFSKYDNIMRSLVWRYVAAMHRKFEDNPVSEDDINEVKSDINTMRYEMLEIFENSGMDVSSANKKERQRRPRRIKVWERRLMKGFQVAPMQSSCELDAFANVNGQGEMREVKVEAMPSKPDKETARERFQRVARTVLLQSTAHKWNMVLRAAQDSQIGRCTKNERQSLHNLGRAIEEAKRLIMLNPGCSSGRESPIRIEFEDEKTSTLLELLNQISAEISDSERPKVKPVWRPPLKSVPARAMAANNVRSLTAPELKIGRKSSLALTPVGTPGHSALRSRELQLCPSKLITAPPKKSAPSAPVAAPASTFKGSTQKPFIRSSDGVPTGSSNFDIHVVDLDEKRGDNVSDISSIASTSPQRLKHPN